MVRFFYVTVSILKMLSFFLAVEALTGLIYHRLAGENSSSVQGRIGYAGTHVPTMSFLNDNDSFAYFAILAELLSGRSFTVGFFKTLSFLSL